MAWLKSYCLVASFLFLSLAHGNEVQFEKGKIWIDKKQVIVEIARTEEQLSRGLMFREKLSEGHGMLFIFPTERRLSFWMKNTFIDLDIGFFNRERKLIDIQEMKAVGSVIENPKSYVSKAPAMYALEVPKGWFKKNKISEGAVFRLE